MKRFLLVAIAGIMIAACARAESAHKGWATVPAQWSGAASPSAVLRAVNMQGPFVPIDKPDPPTNASFQASYLFKTGSTVTVQKVYLLAANEDGTMNTKEIKTTAVSVHDREYIKNYSYASFSTEKVSFKEGDVFVVIFKADGQTIPVFLKIVFNPFVPS
jgi:hypothetical protein